MIGAFMGYALTASGLIGLAALATERLFALRRWPRRALWAFTLAMSLAFPCLMALTRPAISTLPIFDTVLDQSPIIGRDVDRTRDHVAGGVARAQSHEGSVYGALGSVSSRVGLSVGDRTPLSSTSIEHLLWLVWLTSSIAAVLLYGMTWFRLNRLVSRCPRIQVDGISVRVTSTMGPAVFGFFHPEILLPQWLVDALPAVRAAVVAHERAHVASRDPLLLLGALLLVALAPWNPVLWWQLRCLRFAIEADCDARVLKGGTDTLVYSEALLRVGQQRTALPVGFIALITRTSWLERRIRIMLMGTGRLGRLLAGAGVTAAAALLIMVVSLRAPSLAAVAAPAPVVARGPIVAPPDFAVVAQGAPDSGELRKLPPEDTKPGTEWALTLARARFPEVFQPHAEGPVELGMVFARDGSVVLADKHASPTDSYKPLEWRLTTEKAQLGLDDADVLYYEQVDLRAPEGGVVAGDIIYAVLKWSHDPARAEARVQAALEQEHPELRPPNERVCERMTVLMNDDGTINRARSSEHPCQGPIVDDRRERLASLGVASAELGRGGTFVTKSPLRRVSIDYFWPRHVDDPSDIVELVSGQVNSEVWVDHPPREDTRNDAAIAARYFPDLMQGGVVAPVIDAVRYQITPWVLFGRDGRIWQAGRSLIAAPGRNVFGTGNPMLSRELEARYPGIRVQSSLPVQLRTGSGVMRYLPVWIAPDSPIQRREEVDMRRRSDLLLNADFVSTGDVLPTPVVSTQPGSPWQFGVSFVHAVNYDEPAGIGMTQYFIDQLGPQPDHPLMLRVRVTSVDANTVAIDVQTRGTLTAVGKPAPGPEWASAGTLRVAYGAAGAIDLIDTSITSIGKPTRVVLRPQRLRERT
jgi:beta-lactamase regulating signal transducer with metallopeptidase domain